MKIDLQKTIINFLLLIAAVLFLMLPAIKNGYPLFYSDSASYIVSGHDGVVPIDRPILYGLFVRHISMSFSLWFVVFAQAVLFVGLAWLTYKIVIPTRRTSIYTFITCILLALFTGASNYISQIMPDIFSAFMIWSIALIVITDKPKFRWLLFTLALFSSLVHFSNLLTITILATLSLVIILFFRRKIKHFSALIIQFTGLLILPWILLPIINYTYQKEFFINKSSNIFFTGRLIESGILEQYFMKYPESSQYSLYAHKGHLPEKIWQFAWNADSPLYEGDCIKAGWGACWREKSNEYGRMIHSVLSKPDLMADFFKISMKDWSKQVIDFELGPLNQLGENSGFKEITTQYFDDAAMFTKSNQFHGNLTFETESSMQYGFIILAVIFLVILLLVFLKFRLDNIVLIPLIVIVVGLLVNALVCSVFSGVLNRYQGRVIWLIPMVMGVFALVLIQPLLNNMKKNSLISYWSGISFKKLFANKWFLRSLFIAAFVFICLLYNVDNLLFIRPQSLHIWRQTNCLSITQGYNQDNLSFFKSEIQNHYASNGTTGKAAGELPVIYYLVGKLWQIFGHHEWIFRLIQLTIIGFGLLMLFEMLSHFMQNKFHAAFISLLLFTSPMNVFFGLNFLPDTPSVALICIACYFLFRFYLFRRNSVIWWSAFFFFIGIGIKITSAMTFFAFSGWIFIEFIFLKPEKRIFNFSFKQLVPFFCVIFLVVAWYLYANHYNKINGGGFSAFDILPIWRMSQDRLLSVFDSIQKMLFKEFFWPYLQYASVLIWIILLINIRKLSLFLQYLLIVFPLGFLGYLILWFDVLDVHDYYLITSTIVMIPIWFLFFYLMKGTKLMKHPVTNFLLLVFLLANIFSCRNRLEERHKGWMNEWYKQKLEAVGELEPRLDQWGIGKNDLVISIPDYTINATLYLMNRKGFTGYGYDFSKPETFDQLIGVGVKYLIINDSTILNSDPIIQYTTHPVGKYRNVSVYDLSSFRK